MRAVVSRGPGPEGKHAGEQALSTSAPPCLSRRGIVDKPGGTGGYKRMLSGKSNDGPRWPRGQKFSLSLAGREAQEAYRTAVLSARGQSRGALDAALSAWAAPRQVEPPDGVLLGELLERPRGLSDLTGALEDAGASGAEIRAALARLIAAGLVDAAPARAAAVEEQPARRSWYGS